jgi:hypothetical protein
MVERTEDIISANSNRIILPATIERQESVWVSLEIDLFRSLELFLSAIAAINGSIVGSAIITALKS